MKQKYYPEFKNYPEFHKILLKTDLLIRQQQQQQFPGSPTASPTNTSNNASIISNSADSGLSTPPPSFSPSSISPNNHSISSPTSQHNFNSARLINDALTSIDEDLIDSGYMNDSALDSSTCSSGKQD